MKDEPKMHSLMDKDWDRFKIINYNQGGILGEDSPVHAEFDIESILNIDSEHEKVQMCRANSMVIDAYRSEDMQNLPVNGKVRNDDWHRQYMTELTEFILKMVDECDHVPKWLAKNAALYMPQALIPDAQPMF